MDSRKNPNTKSMNKFMENYQKWEKLKSLIIGLLFILVALVIPLHDKISVVTGTLGSL